MHTQALGRLLTMRPVKYVRGALVFVMAAADSSKLLPPAR